MKKLSVLWNFKRNYQQAIEAATKVFLEISQNSQGNTCARVSFLIKLQAQALS